MSQGAGRPNPKFPTAIAAPTVDDCLKNLRISDYCQWGGATAASWGYGFMAGRPARFAMAGLMAGIGFTFGSMVVMQNTRGRLMGYRENGKEVQKLGALADGKLMTAEELMRPTMDWKQFK